MRRQEPPKITVEYVIVDGPEGEELAARQGDAIREVLMWLHAQGGCAECASEISGNEE